MQITVKTKSTHPCIIVPWLDALTKQFHHLILRKTAVIHSLLRLVARFKAVQTQCAVPTAAMHSSPTSTATAATTSPTPGPPAAALVGGVPAIIHGIAESVPGLLPPMPVHLFHLNPMC